MSLDDYLGYGLQIPFQRDGKSGFAAAGSYEHLESKITQVLCTELEEMPWRTDFGANLNRLRHMDNNVDITPMVRQYTVDALEQWLPQVLVTDCSVERVTDAAGEETTLKVRLSYRLRELDGSTGTEPEDVELEL